MIMLDVEYVFQVTGGVKGLVDLLRKHNGGSPAHAAVQMWKHRQSIPGTWAPAVIYALSRAGHGVDTMFIDPDELRPRRQASPKPRK